MEKNLSNEEAIKKFKKIVDDVNICMFITNSRTDREHSRPMATVEAEDDGTLWFYTDIRSIKVEEVSADKEVHLTYAHPGKQTYMDVWGRGSIVTDSEQIKAKWTPIVKAYFPEGADDPNLALLKVKPLNVYYWEAETGKMVHFLKMAASVVTEQSLAEGTKGKISL